MVDVNLDLIYSAISEIYRATYEPASWDGALRSICAALSGSKICLTRAAPQIDPSENITPEADPRFLAMYTERFINNELHRGALPMPVGQCYSDLKVFDHETRRHSTFFNEWLAPQDMYGGLTCKLQADDSSFWFVDIQRGRNQDQFGSMEIDLFGRLVPHFRQALEMSATLRSARTHELILDQLPVAAILVDGQMRAVLHNAAAETILTDLDSPLRLSRGRLMGSDPKADGHLRELVGRVVAPPDPELPGLGADLFLKAAEGATILGLSVSVRPLPQVYGYATAAFSCAAIFIREIGLSLPANFEGNLRAMFALTPKEAAIAAALTAGLPLKAVAEQHNVKLSTARFYLHRIFQKTNTTQQSQLVSLLKSL